MIVGSFRTSLSDQVQSGSMPVCSAPISAGGAVSHRQDGGRLGVNRGTIGGIGGGIVLRGCPAGRLPGGDWGAWVGRSAAGIDFERQETVPPGVPGQWTRETLMEDVAPLRNPCRR